MRYMGYTRPVSTLAIITGLVLVLGALAGSLLAPVPKRVGKLVHRVASVWRRDSIRERLHQRRPLLLTYLGLAFGLAAVFIIWGLPSILTRQPHHGLTAEQELKARNDVRTTLVQAVAGLAVAGGAIVTYRTFRHTRLEQDRAYKLNQSQQVTETYAKAVEQLGHDQAPVRLGALYSLVSLAQDNPLRRQTVVDVLCAYLRMPFAPPRQTEESVPADPEGEERERDAAQEQQVRQTAQRLLADHLRRPENTSGEDAQRIKASPAE